MQRFVDTGYPVDAAAILPDVPQDRFPAQALTAELYLESGVRGMERGVVSAGRDPETGDHHYPKLELVRLTIPRRVYTQAHMDYVIEVVASVYERREELRGMKFIRQPRALRHFTGRFDYV